METIHLSEKEIRTMDIIERLTALRGEMSRNGMDIYIVPTADFHQSEYVGEHFKARKFITGFSGSAGTAVVTLDEARLWVDGRYFIQAAQQLEGTTIELMKIGEPGVPSITEYLAGALKQGDRIGFDGRVVSVDEGLEYERTAAAAGADIICDTDLIASIWKDRPPMSTEPAFYLDTEYTGETTAEKLSRIREEMKKAGATVHALTTIDDICWILNIRGNDIEFFPLVLSYAVITMDSMELFIDDRKLDDSIRRRFAEDNVNIHPYNDIYEYIRSLSAEDAVLIDTDRLNYALYRNTPDDVIRIEAQNPSVLMKAVKNDVEIANIRKAQIKDSVAHVKFMKWVKENYDKQRISEISASEKLDELRAEQGGFIRPSFEPISSYGEHGAIVHYTARPETDAVLGDGFFLTDTGAGFYEGSTDITRTYALGKISDEMKEHFTLVAISNLSLADAKFLEGSNGMVLDILARKPFWDRNLNFNHGTGHGVGYLLNIHEAPAGFRYTVRKHEIAPLKAGMILTDEPGIYIEGAYGIRLENELLTCLGVRNEYGQFMHFEPLTFVPFDLDAIEPSMMNDEQKKLLNDYHRKVYETVSPLLDEDEREWLKKYTREI